MYYNMGLDGQCENLQQATEQMSPELMQACDEYIATVPVKSNLLNNSARHHPFGSHS